MHQLPGFEIDPKWVPDNLGYLVVNDLARYLCEQASLADWENVRQGTAFLERSLEGGDLYVRDLVHEALEALLSCDRVSEIKVHFPKRLRTLWDEFMEAIYQQGIHDSDLR